MKIYLPSPNADDDNRKKNYLINKNAEAIENDGLLWIDVQRPSHAEMDRLAEKFGFHILNVDDTLSKNQLPKIDRYDDHDFIILQFPIVEKGAAVEAPKTSQLSIFIGKSFLVTAHKDEFKPLSELREQCQKDENMRKLIMGESSGFLFHHIIDAMVDDLLHIIRKIVGNMDDIEDIVFDEKVAAPREIARLRREIMVLRRIVTSLKKIMLDFSAKDAPRFSDADLDAKSNLAQYYADVNDHIAKIAETLDAARETIEIYKDSDFTLSTDRSNKILEILTLVFTLSLPALLLSAFYGMNVAIPGTTKFSPWTFWGPYTTLIVIGLISAGSAFAMLWYFRRIGWVSTNQL